jgi:hypothetical protein
MFVSYVHHFQLQEVGFRYCGTRRNIGTFDTQDLAALANRVGRQLLTAEKGVTLTAAEIEENVMLARAASVKAVSKLQHEDDAPPNEENRLEILLLSEEAADRPRLLSIRLQPEKVNCVAFHSVLCWARLFAQAYDALSQCTDI